MSIASKRAFLNALRADYNTNIAVALSLPTQYPNAPFTIPDATSWADWTVLFGDEVQRTVGSTTRRFRVTGILQVDVYTPMRQGEDAGMVTAEAIGDRYSGTDRAGATFRDHSVTPLGRSGGWFRHVVRCSFQADRFR